jgi:hypothetical protein
MLRLIAVLQIQLFQQFRRDIPMRILIALAILLLTVSAAEAEMYQWTAED